MRSRGIFIGIAGLWLILTGFWGYAPVAQFWSNVISGAIVTIVGLSMVGTLAGRGSVAIILGIWSIVAAFLPAIALVVGVLLAITGLSTPATIDA